MAAPNIANTSSIFGRLAAVAVNEPLDVNNIATWTTVLTNPAASNSVYKINTLHASNRDGVSPADMHLSLLRGGVTYPMLRFTTVPAEAMLVIISKDNTIWLEEGDSIIAASGATDRITITCSYEIITATT
jgi:hypothetical protein